MDKLNFFLYKEKEYIANHYFQNNASPNHLSTLPSETKSSQLAIEKQIST